MIDRTEWLERVLSLANIVLDLNGDQIRSARSKTWFEDYILDKTEQYLRNSSLMGSDHLDYIRHTELAEFEPEWWRSADTWNSVIFHVSFHCLSHDVRNMVLKILDGNAPRRSSPLNKAENADNGD